MMNYLEKKKKAMLNYVSGGRLPSEYQEVEWIENGNTADNNVAYIKTNYIPTENTKLEISYMAFSNSANISVVADTNGRVLFGLARESANKISGYYNRTRYIGNANDNERHFIELSADEFVIDDVVVASSLSGTYVQARDLPIFAYNNGRYFPRHLRLYSYKLYESGTLVRDYVCCYRKSDDKVGLYDLVNSEFVTSANNYEFTKGQDV